MSAAVAFASAGSSAARDGDNEDEAECPVVRGNAEAIPAARLIIEHNSTDEDTGVHGLFDSSGWSELCAYERSGNQTISVCFFETE